MSWFGPTNRAYTAPVNPGFAFFISTTGSPSNSGSLASPWDIGSLINAGKQALYIGKKVGVIAGTYNLGLLGTVGAGTSAFNVPVVNIPGGTPSSPTVIASCDASGNYAPAGNAVSGTWAILNGGQTDTAKRLNDSTTTSTVLSDSTASMTPGQYADGLHYLTFNTYNGNDSYTSQLITANTATTITVGTPIPPMGQGTVSTISGTGVISAPNGYFGGAGAQFSAVSFKSTGTLPNGITANTVYYVSSLNLSSTTFSINTVAGNNGTQVNPGQSWTGTLTVYPAGCYFITNNPNSSPMIGAAGAVATYSNVTIQGFEMTGCTGRIVDIRYPSGGVPRLTNVNVNDCYLHDQATSFGYGDNTTAITFTSVDGTNGGTTINASGTTNCTFSRIFTTDGSGRSDAIEYWACFGCTSKNNTIVCVAPFATPGSNIVGMNTLDMAGSSAECINYKNHGNSGNSIIGNYIDAHLTNAGAGGGCGMDYDNTGPYSPNTDVHAFNLIIAGLSFYKAVAGVSLPFAEQEQYYNNTFILSPGNSAPTGILRHTQTNTITCYNNIYSTSGAWYTYGASSFDADAPVLIDYEMFAGSGGYKRSTVPAGTDGAETPYTSIATYAATLPAGCIGKEAHSIVTASAAGFTGTGVLAAKYQLSGASPFKNMGNTTGNSGTGSATDPGCWGNGNTQVGSLYAAALGFT